MLKQMENDYMFHWDMRDLAMTNRWRDTQMFHDGVCYAILNHYAMFLDCTLDEARERLQDRMHKRIRGAAC
jgi:hypothetical protein